MEDRDRSMSDVTLTVTGLAKQFNRRLIFRDISFSISAGDSLAITGKNGSGKSTLVKILCGVLSATAGTVQYAIAGKNLSTEHARNRLGLVSPYLQLYDEFSALENLQLLSQIRSNDFPFDERSEEALKLVGLWDRRRDFVRTYSSGMKQRLKYAFALLHRPSVLILDEPTANLDAEGVSVVKRVADEQKRSAILVVATNDEDEAAWCRQRIHLGNDKI
ncbi:MAG: ABC transporter ATP-binding protein [Bacteroidota bacterium]